MLKTLLFVLAGLAAMVLALFAFKGLIYVADTGAALDEAVARPGPALEAEFPRAEGFDQEALTSVRQQAADSGVAGLVVLHDGRLVAEWGRTHVVASLGDGRAGVISLLWGIGRARGALPGDAAPPSPGVAAAAADSAARALVAATGRPLGELLGDWLARPLGMADFEPAHVARHVDPQAGAETFDIRLSTRDLARIGALVLAGGRRGGAPVVPAAWVEESTAPLAPSGRRSHAGRGWLLPVSGRVESRGRGGQRLHVDRQLDLVVAVGVLTGEDASERAVWTVFGERHDGGDFAELLRRVKRAGGLGQLDPTFAGLVEAGHADSAVAHARALRRAEPDTFLYTEAQLNGLGYELLQDDRVDEAIAVFALNVETFPHYFNTYDSLGEAYYEAGDLERARTNYERALELNPGLRSATRMLRRIEDAGEDSRGDDEEGTP